MKDNISVGKDFSIYPGGRTPDDGPDSGEDFREKFLVPVLKSHQCLTIALDDTRGYGSSFLEESFGGLIRQGFTRQDIDKYIKLVSDNPSLLAEINHYIDAADERSKRQ